MRACARAYAYALLRKPVKQTDKPLDGVKLRTEVIEIEGAQLQNHWHPPPTAQTPGPNWLIFWREAPHLIAFRGTEAIFESPPESQDMSPFLA